MMTNDDDQAQARPDEEYGYVLAASDHNRREDRSESATAYTNGVSTKETPTILSRKELEIRKADVPGVAPYSHVNYPGGGIWVCYYNHEYSVVAETKPFEPSYYLAFQALVTIVGIIIVTHKYIATAAMVRWNPTTLDTLVPYLIGLGEISAALLIGHQSSWWFAISFWLLTAIFVQGHTCSERRQIILITRQITISTSAGRLNSDDLRHRHAHHEPGCRTTGLLSKWVALAKYRIARRRHSGRDCNLSDRHGGSWKGRR
jgi:hypothetical protein